MLNRILPDPSNGDCETFAEAFGVILDQLPEKVTIERLVRLLSIEGPDEVIRTRAAIGRLRKDPMPKKLRVRHVEMIARALNCSPDQETRLLKGFGCSRLIDGL